MIAQLMLAQLLVLKVRAGINGQNGAVGEQGPQGVQGPQGIGVSNATISQAGELELTLSDTEHD